MVSPGQALWGTLRDAFDSAMGIVVSNVLWFLLTVPLLTAPAAAAGAYTNAYRLAIHQPATARSFFQGARKYAWAGYRYFLMNLFVLIVFFVNYVFYGQFQVRWAVWVQGIILGFTVIWLALNAFIFPLYLAQKEKRMLAAVRNSLVFFVKMPGMCLSLLSFLLLLYALSTLLGIPWLLISTILGLMLCCRFTILMLEKSGYHPEEDLHLNVDAD